MAELAYGVETKEPKGKEPEFLIGVASEGRSDKVAKGKQNRIEEGICRGGDDCAFFQRFHPNKHEVLISGMVLDGVSEGGLGHEAAFSAGKRIRKLLTNLFLQPRKRFTRNEVAGEVLGKMQGVNQGIRFERNQKLARIKKEKGPSDQDTYATTGALFLVQKGYDSRTGEPRLYLHTWSTGDSFVGVGLKIDKKPYEVYRMNVPHNIAGDFAARDLGIAEMSTEELANLTIGQQSKKVAEFEETYSSSVISGAFGFEDKLEEDKVDYQRIILPAGPKVKNLRIVAMTDGIWGTVEPRKITAVLENFQGNEAAMKLVGLGKELDLDDCCAVVASLKEAS